MRSMQTLLRQYKGIQHPLRFLRYHFWSATGVTQLAGYWPELGPLEAIARRSPPSEFEMQEDGQRVLFFTFRYWNTHVLWDALLAHALRQRGAHVRFLVCGGGLPICDVAPHTLAPPMPCDNCAPYVDRVLRTLRLPAQDLRDYITKDERREIRRIVTAVRPDEYEEYISDDLPIGRLVRASVNWFLLSGNPEFDAGFVNTYQEFLYSGSIIARAVGRALDTYQPSIVYLLNGLFFAERIVIEQARRRGIEFITHESGFFADTQVFARNGFAPYYPLDAYWPHYAGRPLTASEARRLDEYIEQRFAGKRDVSQYYPSIESNPSAIYKNLGLDPSRKVVSMYTNVDWDTACFAAGSAFKSMEEWIEHTILHFINNDTGSQLVIRIHPAEVRLPFQEPRVKAADLIRKRFSHLPAHIHIIPPESHLSSYSLMEISHLNLVYTSTIGLEAVLRGLPTIAAGRGYYTGKGFTREVATPDEYHALLTHMSDIHAPTAQEVELARRYASLFFFRHHIPFPLTQTRNGRITLMFDRLDALRPGREPMIDLLCDAILYGAPFLYEGEL